MNERTDGVYVLVGFFQWKACRWEELVSTRSICDGPARVETNRGYCNYIPHDGFWFDHSDWRVMMEMVPTFLTLYS